MRLFSPAVSNRSGAVRNTSRCSRRARVVQPAGFRECRFYRRDLRPTCKPAHTSRPGANLVRLLVAVLSPGILSLASSSLVFRPSLFHVAKRRENRRARHPSINMSPHRRQGHLVNVTNNNDRKNTLVPRKYFAVNAAPCLKYSTRLR